MAMAGDSTLSWLETDLRQLSNESRKAESLTGQLTGWLSGPEHPQIKESAERAMLRLRTAAKSEGPGAALRTKKVHGLAGSHAKAGARACCTVPGSLAWASCMTHPSVPWPCCAERGTPHAQEALKPFLAACGVKAPKLASIAVMTIQKMLANNLVAEEDMRAIVRALEQVWSAPAIAPHKLCMHPLQSFPPRLSPGIGMRSRTGSMPFWSARWPQVEELRDEGVQLKTLQTALTLMQSPVLAEDEVG